MQRLQDTAFYQPCRPIAAMIYDRLSLARHAYTEVIVDAKKTSGGISRVHADIYI